MIFDLPTALEVGGREWPINSDYRDVLRTLTAFEDPDVTEEEKAYICLHNTYPDLEDIPKEDLQAAFDAAVAFIDHGNADDGRPSPRTMDWAQDANLIFPAVNRVAGFEVRAVDYLHWWTFLGYFMEIRNTTYATILGLRGKKARGKKLEKDEKEFWNHNRGLCELKTRYTEEELEEQARLKAIIGG
jgi:hypothetical protein